MHHNYLYFYAPIIFLATIHLRTFFSRGGKGVPVIMDHSNDADVTALFERVKEEWIFVDDIWLEI